MTGKTSDAREFTDWWEPLLSAGVSLECSRDALATALGLDRDEIRGMSDDAVRRALQRLRQLAEQARRLAAIAETDDLTGAFRRDAGRNALARDIAHALRQAKPRLCLAFIDVDHLKEVNDTLGHEVGDQLLRTVVTTLQERLRPYDIVVRYGGDEFVVALPGLDAPGAEKLFTEFAVKLAGRSGGRTITVGITELREDDTVDTVVARADAALLAQRSTQDATRDRRHGDRKNGTDTIGVMTAMSQPQTAGVLTTIRIDGEVVGGMLRTTDRVTVVLEENAPREAIEQLVGRGPTSVLEGSTQRFPLDAAGGAPAPQVLTAYTTQHQLNDGLDAESETRRALVSTMSGRFTLISGLDPAPQSGWLATVSRNGRVVGAVMRYNRDARGEVRRRPDGMPASSVAATAHGGLEPEFGNAITAIANDGALEQSIRDGRFTVKLGDTEIVLALTPLPFDGRVHISPATHLQLTIGAGRFPQAFTAKTIPPAERPPVEGVGG